MNIKYLKRDTVSIVYLNITKILKRNSLETHLTVECMFSLMSFVDTI